MFSEIIPTQRLVLRTPILADAGDAFERFTGNPLASRYLLWKTHENEEQTRKFLAKKIEVTKASNSGRWAICLQDDDSMWGSIAVALNGHAVEVGFMLCPELWGKGLITEALTAVVTEVWNHPQIWRIAASCHPDNVASARVLEKCGFEREGLARRYAVMPQINEAPQDCYLYALVRS